MTGVQTCALPISWDSIGERAAAWERFIHRYPRSPYVERAREIRGYYRETFLGGTGNTPAFDYGSPLNGPRLPMRNDLRESLRQFVARHPTTELAAIVREYLKILVAGDFRETEDVQLFFQKYGVRPH